MTWHYTHVGLHVASAIELPEWSDSQSPSTGQPDVTIRLDRAMRETETPHVLDVDLPAIAHYQIDRGCEIRIHTSTDACGQTLRSILLGSVWSALLYQRHIFPLHASVIQTPHGAVAFCGPSGSGKSSLAAYFTHHLGRRDAVISDDLARVDVESTGDVRVWPGVARLKLWRDMVEYFQIDRTTLEAETRGRDKYFLPAGVPHRHPVRLVAIYLLGIGEDAVVRLKGFEAVRALADAACCRPQWIARLQLNAGWLRYCTSLAAKVPIWRLRRPAQGLANPSAGRRLLDEWAQDGTPSFLYEESDTNALKVRRKWPS